ncbi:MAG: serine/threonine-protein kinase [Vicinamibacterales bacterium]
MSLDDAAVARLRAAADVPDLGPRYDVRAAIGHGGSSVVYAAWDHALDREVAVKVADAYRAATDTDVPLTREARILAALEHPGIVPVHDTGVTPDGRAFYVMTLVRGRSLAAAAAAVSVPARIGLFLKVCEAVAFAHARGVVHRDLKPQNVMVGPFGEVLVLDWGVAATAAGEDGAGGPPAVVGTPGFMPPEQAAGVSAVDERADVYALGALLDGLVGPAAPRPLAAVVERARAVRREDRYAGVAALEADVRRYLDGLAVSAYAEPLVERVMRVVDRYRVPIGLVAAYMVMRIVLLYWTS